jgi:hypothetical protein
MLPGLTALIGPAITGIVNLVDELHTSDEEKGQLKVQILAMQAGLLSSTFEYEKALFEQKAEIIKAEATSTSWLTRMWRPITMMVFVALVAAHWLGFTAPNLSEAMVLKLLTIVQYGLTGYIVGRSAEKLTPKAIELWKAKAESE